MNKVTMVDEYIQIFQLLGSFSTKAFCNYWLPPKKGFEFLPIPKNKMGWPWLLLDEKQFEKKIRSINCIEKLKK